MATTGPDSISGWKNISRYDIYDDKKKRKKQNETAQNSLQKAPAASAQNSNSTYENKGSGGKSSAASPYNKNSTASNKTAGVFDSIKLPYEDTVAQKNAQKAADLKRQQEKYNAEKLAQKQAAEAKAAQEKYAREKYIAQMRQQQRDGQLKGTGMQSNAVRSNPFTSAVPKLNYTPGKIEVRSAITQSQWNKGVSGRNKSANTSTVKSYGPNREMANAVKTNPQKNTVPKTVASPKPTVNAAGPSAEMGKAVQNSYRPSATADNKQFFNGLAKGLTGVVWPDKDVAGTERIEKQNRQSVQNMGPNTEIGSITKNWNKPLTMDELIDIASKLTGGIGPNREMENSVVLVNQGRKPEIGTGPNVEIGQKNFLDYRENNVFKSYFDEYRYDKMIEDAYKPQEEYFVGKDSIYKKEPKEISEDYRKVYNTVQPEYLKKKEELADLEFYKKYARLDEEGLKNLEKTKAEVEKLEYIRKKAALGAKMNFAFLGNDMDKLSKMSIDDILNSEELYNNLPYLSEYAQLARSTNQSIAEIKKNIDLLNCVKIKYDKTNDKFTVYDSDNPQNSFSFRIKSVKSPKGYTESKIIVDKSDTKYSGLIINDLHDSIDNITVPDNAEKILRSLAESKFISKSAKGLDSASKILDIIDLYTVLYSDISDNGEAGNDFSSEFFGTIGAWTGEKIGGIVGGSLGIAGGAVFGPIGSVILGPLGAFAGAYIMSSVMEDIGEYVGESLNDSDYTIEQYHSRAK